MPCIALTTLLGIPPGADRGPGVLVVLAEADGLSALVVESALGVEGIRRADASRARHHRGGAGPGHGGSARHRRRGRHRARPGGARRARARGPRLMDEIRLLELFREDAESQLDLLQEGIVQAERDAGPGEALTVCMRAAHSSRAPRGSSGWTSWCAWRMPWRRPSRPRATAASAHARPLRPAAGRRRRGAARVACRGGEP